MPQAPLQFEQSEIDGAVIVRLGGELDGAQVASMEKHFEQLAAGKPRMLIVDLSGATVMSSVAMGAVLRLHTALRSTGGKLAVSSVPALVLAALRRARLDLLIPVHKDLQTALAAHRMS